MAGKSGILALLATPKGGSKGPPMGESKGGGGEHEEVGSALREMFDALKAGDDDGAALAFKRAYSCCSDEHDEPDADEMGGPSDEDEDNLEP